MPSPMSTFPLPPEPPIDLGALIGSTNVAADGVYQPVTRIYQAMDQGLNAAEGGIKKAGQPVLKALARRTASAGKALTGIVTPLAAALSDRTAAAQVALQQYPPTSTPTSVYWAAVRCPDLSAQVIPAERGSPPEPGPGWRLYGPYATDAAAVQAAATFQAYLRNDPSCQGAPAPGPADAGPLDWYWVE